MIDDVLSRQICRDVEEKRVEGIRIKRTCPEIYHLFFADYSNFFMKVNERNVRALKMITKSYREASGQKINYDKSCIQFGATTREETRRMVANTMGVREVENTGKYLGFPTSWGRSKREMLWFLKEKIAKKLHSWKTLFLNQEGKETLIKVVITAIPTYLMTLFRLPKTWCEDVTKLIA